jgi:hypothetical protein
MGMWRLFVMEFGDDLSLEKCECASSSAALSGTAHNFAVSVQLPANDGAER